MPISVALVEPHYEANVGYVARVMKNFGVPKLLLVHPRARLVNARKFASHGADVLDEASTCDFDEIFRCAEIVVGTTAIPAKREANVARSAVSPAELADFLKDVSEEVCLVLGRDTTGLTTQELSMCDMVVTIPTGTNYPTLNVAHALAILLYELSRQRRIRKRPLAAREQRTRATNFAVQLARLAGYPNHKLRMLELVLNRIFARSAPTPKELFLILGLFRRAVAALQKQRRFQ